MREKNMSDGQTPSWLEAMQDPVREDLHQRGAKPDLDAILQLFPRPQSPPAFCEKVIESSVERLSALTTVSTGHAFLDRSVLVGLAHIDATFQGDHPKYGVKEYGRTPHDTFPPTIIAAIDALSAWGLHERAKALFRYWLTHFVREDGTVNYRGTSVSELGQLLHTADVLFSRAGGDGWLTECASALDRLCENLLRMLRAGLERDGLIFGVPEDDEKNSPATYFHNNAWAVRGLAEWAALSRRAGLKTVTAPTVTDELAAALKARTLAALKAAWPADPSDWWLRPHVEALEKPARITGSRKGSYTNYRYWPELLSSGILPTDMANRVVEARLASGGQFCGMTRFADWLDDWPLADYLYGLWSLGRKDDFLLSLYGHVAYHQADGHLTAYEQVTFPPGKEKAPYCLPCQLVAARTARLLA